MKIVFVDTWIRGLHFVNPVALELAKKTECVFIHSSENFGNGVSDEISTVLKDNFPGLLIDVKSAKSFAELLCGIGPCVVFFISIHGPFQRAFNVECERLGIKCFFFMHGARFDEKLPSRLERGFAFYASRVKFYLEHFAQLFSKVRGLRSKMLLVLMFFEFFAFKNKFNLNPSVKVGLNYDCMFLNHEQDVTYFERFVGKNINYTITGNSSVIESCRRSLDFSSIKNSIVIFGQPGFTEACSDTTMISDIREIVRMRGLSVVIRPHPTESDTEISNYQLLFGECAQIDRSQDMSLSLSKAVLLVGFNSNALSASSYLGLPTLTYSCARFPALPYLDSRKDFTRLESVLKYDLTPMLVSLDDLTPPNIVISRYLEYHGYLVFSEECSA